MSPELVDYIVIIISMIIMDNLSGNYNKYSNKNPLMGMVTSRFLNQVKQLTYSASVNKILDVGCGEGFVIKVLSPKVVVGIDISRRALTIAKEQNQECCFFEGNINNLPFDDSSFDLVLATEVLEHLKEPEKAINEIKRTSKKYCIFSVPNEPYFRLMNLLRMKNVSRLGSDIEHVQNWSSDSFVTLLKNYFEVIEIRRPFPWTVVLCEKK